jgi:hypothetical protein
MVEILCHLLVQCASRSFPVAASVLLAAAEFAFKHLLERFFLVSSFPNSCAKLGN